MSDAEIIEKVLAGDVNSFESLVTKYEKMIYNLAFTKLQHRETAQDISQECFLRAYKMLRSYRAESAFSTWIYRICQNLIADYYRKQKKTGCSLSFSYAGENGEFKESDIPDPESDPAETVVREEKIKKIREIIDSLPEDLREIIILRDFEDLSYANIAEILETEIGTVKSRLFRAREKLREYLINNNKDGELF